MKASRRFSGDLLAVLQKSKGLRLFVQCKSFGDVKASLSGLKRLIDRACGFDLGLCRYIVAADEGKAVPKGR
jgi:hypothetical protein